MTTHRSRASAQGFSLIELMIAVAVLSILAFIAIPAYNGYTREARYGAARANMGSLRIALEDFRLDNATYKVDGEDSYNPEDADKEEDLGWTPQGDGDHYSYLVTATQSTYHILVVIGSTTPERWVFCQDNMDNCCDDSESGASKTACPP